MLNAVKSDWNFKCSENGTYCCILSHLVNSIEFIEKLQNPNTYTLVSNVIYVENLHTKSEKAEFEYYSTSIASICVDNSMYLTKEILTIEN